VDPGRFFRFLIFYTVSRASWTGIGPLQGLYLHTEQHKHRINAHRHHYLKWIRTQDLSVREAKDGSCFRPRGHCDRRSSVAQATSYSYYSLSLSFVAPTLEYMAAAKHFVSLPFLNLRAVGRTPWMADQPVARPLPTQDNTRRINADTHP
jgi:hypothetical protein